MLPIIVDVYPFCVYKAVYGSLWLDDDDDDDDDDYDNVDDDGDNDEGYGKKNIYKTEKNGILARTCVPVNFLYLFSSRHTITQQ